MDRRSFLVRGAGAVALSGTLAGGYAATALAGPSRTNAETKREAKAKAPGELLWAADLSAAKDSSEAGFGNVQVQYGGGDIENDGPPMPVVDHPELGRALKITLEENQERYEAAPGAGDDCGEGQELFFRVDFALDKDFPVDQENPFCLVNQIHHGGNDGSPPIEFDVNSGKLSVRGAGDAYTKELGPIAVDTVCKLVYRVRFSADPASSLLEVWLDDKQVLADFQPPCATLIDGNSYWKGATMYCDPSIPPLTVFQNAHRVGTTYESVTA
ncbi:polysaccharide lyase-like protein [Streptomyces sp. Amel2xB2]|uniref:heparin lyase I family protein n=1 Tax=Streptomyces sp. Amel2xB2 TaxID=1305829 RepID=UPI000DBFF003|nr:heparin lyase I family protein [Streptomyces sp. Amel2xB2]RAJ68830.1 polysaccharide lyase-like protein [Streptomyces sp. Amel2xB2]